mmetsp:Transcript_106039/g.316700  ORF Transcript_106039/g.316700 Transcript_106039/m.316700 type:complete len:201 (+) Transcript_106039:265-867(+)
MCCMRSASGEGTMPGGSVEGVQQTGWWACGGVMYGLGCMATSVGWVSGEWFSMGASSWYLDAEGGGVEGGRGKTGRAGVDGRGGVTSCTGVSLSSRSRGACRAEDGDGGSARGAAACRRGGGGAAARALETREAEELAAAAWRSASGDIAERSGILIGAEVPKVNSCALSSSKPFEEILAPSAPLMDFAEGGREPGLEFE